VFNLLCRMDSLDAQNTHFLLQINNMTLITIYKVMIRSKVSQKYLKYNMNKILVFSLILDFCDSKGFCKPSFSDALQSLVEATPAKGQVLTEKKCMTLIRSSFFYIGPI